MCGFNFVDILFTYSLSWLLQHLQRQRLQWRPRMVRLQTRQTSSGATTEARRSRVLEAGSSEVMARLGQSGVSIQGMGTNHSSVLP